MRAVCVQLDHNFSISALFGCAVNPFKPSSSRTFFDPFCRCSLWLYRVHMYFGIQSLKLSESSLNKSKSTWCLIFLSPLGRPLAIFITCFVNKKVNMTNKIYKDLYFFKFTVNLLSFLFTCSTFICFSGHLESKWPQFEALVPVYTLSFFFSTKYNKILKNTHLRMHLIMIMKNFRHIQCVFSIIFRLMCFLWFFLGGGGRDSGTFSKFPQIYMNFIYRVWR